MNSVRDAIAQRLPGMSKSHRLLAGYIQAHGEKAAFMTSFQLASVTGLSQSTVVRFATVLGFGGFGELSQALRDGLKYRLDAVERYERLQETASDSALLDALAATDALNIKNTLGSNDAGLLSRLAACLHRAKGCYMYGQGLAAPAALYLSGYLGLLVPQVTCVNLSGMDAFTTLSGMGEGDLLLTVSFALHTPATLALIELARSREALSVAISEAANSKVGRLADISLMSEWGELGVNGSMAPVMALCNAIICLTARQAPGAAPGLAALGEAQSHMPQEAP